MPNNSLPSLLWDHHFQLLWLMGWSQCSCFSITHLYSYICVCESWGFSLYDLFLKTYALKDDLDIHKYFIREILSVILPNPLPTKVSTITVSYSSLSTGIHICIHGRKIVVFGVFYFDCFLFLLFSPFSLGITLIFIW